MLYICYNREDSTSALYLSQKLKHHNIEYWIDVERLLAGDLLPQTIEEGLNKSSGILVCISKNAITDWQHKEITTAFNLFRKNKSFRIIPVLLPGSSEDLIPILLQGHLWIDFRVSFENQYEAERLFAAIKGVDILPSNQPATTKQEIIKKSDGQRNKRAVSVALFFEGEIFILQRAETQKSGQGLWQIPGGKIRDDETPALAAVREVEEETGLLLEQEKLMFITDLVDTWIINNSDDYITMSLFLAYVSNKQSDIANEFQSGKWIKISELFSDDNIIYFGSTSRYLRIIRRFINLHLPLKELAEILSLEDKTKTLPTRLEKNSIETTQVIYSFLSLLGFLDDKKKITSSSTLSGKLIKLMSEWALTESVIFEADGDRKWQDEVKKKGNLEQVERFRQGLFDKHEYLLGLLSNILPKALSTRYVCDVLLTGFNQYNSKTYLLVRWDFLAKKYQIPSKGLEEFKGIFSSVEAAQYTLGERLSENLIDKLDYKYFNKITRTSHVGSSSLGEYDGAILRNYIVYIFDLVPKPQFNNEILNEINQINSDTIVVLRRELELGHKIKRALNFYVWVDLDYLEQKRISLLGKLLQGYNEIISTFGTEFIRNNRSSIVLNENNRIPIIDEKSIGNSSQLDFIIEKHYNY